MTAFHRYIFALLIAGLLLVQLGQAQHYKTHFQEPAYQTTPHKQKPAHSDADDNCAFCLFLKAFGGIITAGILLLVRVPAYLRPEYLRKAFAAFGSPLPYAARAPPLA